NMQPLVVGVANHRGIVQSSYQPHIGRRHEMLQQDVMRLCHRLLLPCGHFIHDHEAAIALRITPGIPADHVALPTLALRIAPIEDKIDSLHLVSFHFAYPQVSGDNLTTEACIQCRIARPSRCEEGTNTPCCLEVTGAGYSLRQRVQKWLE